VADKLEQVTDRVWLWPHHRNHKRVESSIGVILGDHETLLVDAGNGPPVAALLQKEMQNKGFPPVTTIVYTHHHWDHVFGACAFDATIVAHTLCKQILVEQAQKPWGVEYLQAEIQKNPKRQVSFTALKRAIKDWGAFKIIIPEVVFKRSKVLYLGNLRVELQHVGGNHAEDSIVVKVPEEGVMFLGDCFYPPPLHLRGTDISVSITMLSSLEDEAYSLYIDGHGKPFTHRALVSRLQRQSKN